MTRSPMASCSGAGSRTSAAAPGSATSSFGLNGLHDVVVRADSRPTTTSTVSLFRVSITIGTRLRPDQAAHLETVPSGSIRSRSTRWAWPHGKAASALFFAVATKDRFKNLHHAAQCRASRPLRVVIDDKDRPLINDIIP